QGIEPNNGRADMADLRRAVIYGASQVCHVGPSVVRFDALACEITHEAAGEAIARARWVEHVFQQKARRHEVFLAVKENRAIFAALDNQSVRPHSLNLGGG